MCTNLVMTSRDNNPVELMCSVLHVLWCKCVFWRFENLFCTIPNNVAQTMQLTPPKWHCALWRKRQMWPTVWGKKKKKTDGRCQSQQWPTKFKVKWVGGVGGDMRCQVATDLLKRKWTLLIVCRSAVSRNMLFAYFSVTKIEVIALVYLSNICQKWVPIKQMAWSRLALMGADATEVMTEVTMQFPVRQPLFIAINYLYCYVYCYIFTLNQVKNTFF